MKESTTLTLRDLLFAYECVDKQRIEYEDAGDLHRAEILASVSSRLKATRLRKLYRIKKDGAVSKKAVNS